MNRNEVLITGSSYDPVMDLSMQDQYKTRTTKLIDMKHSYSNVRIALVTDSQNNISGN